MEILFANRKDSLVRLGGDSIQMSKTKDFLELNYNYKIEIIRDPSDVIHKKQRIIHIFNIQTVDNITYQYIIEAIKSNKKTILTPIFWDLTYSTIIDYFFRYLNISNFYKFENIIMGTKSIFTLFMKLKHNDLFKKQKFILDKCDIILPNSPEELNIIACWFGIPLSFLESKSFIVPNAVDPFFGFENNTNPENKLNINGKIIENFVLEVGRIESAKNQMSVILSLIEYKEIPIVFVGRVYDHNYYKTLLTLANKRGNVYFIPEIDHYNLKYFYSNCSVHVLPSFRESPGLSSLEALISGAEIVVSNNTFCPVEFYKFEEFGHLCNPLNIKSIRYAILDSITNKRNTITKNYKYEFSYNKVSEITDNVYKKLIQS